MIKKASAIWKRRHQGRRRRLSTESGVLNNAAYGFKSQFENGKGTNPEELLGAAHAGCFSMALSLILGEAGMTAEKIETQAAVTLEKVGDGFSITSSHLDIDGQDPQRRSRRNSRPLPRRPRRTARSRKC